MLSDISSVLVWWATISIIGLIFFPISYHFFRKFADRGYIFTKVIGILLSSYFIWLMGSLKVMPFTRITIIITLLGWAFLAIWLMKNLVKKEALKMPIFLMLFEELLFLLTLAFWSYVKATEPSIHGLEKFMDFGFVNSILRSNYFPPPDMWLAKSPDYAGGYFINYYYFGHYMDAFLTKLSGIDSAVTYNLMLSTLFAFTFTLSFSIGLNLYYFYNLIRSKIEKGIKTVAKNINPGKAITCGFLAAFLVSLGGNLHTIYSFTGNYPVDNPVPPWQLNWGLYPERYWYPNATRFIPFTIHEFPVYSFVVSDLHGHVSDIPFVLLSLALLLALVTEREKEEKKSEESGHGIISSINGALTAFEKHTSIPFPSVFLLGLLLSVMYMTNAWDGMIYMILTGLVFLYINLKKSGSDLKGAQGLTLFSSLYAAFSASLFLVFFFLLSNLPFSLNFRPFVSGIGVLCAPAFLLGKKLGPFIFETGKCQKSPIWMMAILWGFFYYNVVGYFIFVLLPALRNKSQITNIKSQTNPKSQISKSKLFRILSFKHWNLFGNCLPAGKAGKLSSLSGIPSVAGEIGNLNPVEVFILILIFISTLLLIFPEYFYMKDIYPAHYRANTMFKLGYQAFMMLGLVSAFVIIRLRRDSPGIKMGIKYIIYQAIFVVLFILVGIYPYFAVNSYFGGLKVYHGLNGLNWLETQYPDDYKAIQWLRLNIQCNNVTIEQCNNSPVIVEANGDSYTDYARVSANTGLPTIVGWPVHEWLWRGSYDEAGRRIPEVAIIYESKDVEATKAILKKYNVEYIFVGSLEREKYKNPDMEKFGKLGTVVFESGGTKIFKVSN